MIALWILGGTLVVLLVVVGVALAFFTDFGK
jgi:hypothetical protein